MEITVLAVPECPNLDLARRRLAEALHETHRDATVCERLVTTDDEAQELGFGGSPTILIDGRDPFPVTDIGFACRTYPTGEGTEGAPALDALVEAVTA